MAARRNDPLLRRAALRMTDGGMSCWAIASILGIAHTTVRHYVRTRDLDNLPEPALPRRQDRPTCYVCGGPCTASELGHAACTGRKVA